MDRRAFLTATGLAGAATAPGPLTGVARAAGPADSALVLRALTRLTADTMSGLAVFVLPGPDAYSRAQGTPRREPGAIEAGVPAFLVDALNRYLPFPDQVAVPLMRALVQGAGSLSLPAPREGDAQAGTVRRVDAGLRRLLENDATIPLAPVVALLLNLEAVRVDPLAVGGPFLSPFARLRYARKARVFQLLEGPDPTLVAILDRHLPEPLRGSVSGLLKFLAGALLELTALGSYSEWAVFDPQTRRLRGRPVGWRICGYTPSADGWDEHRGYYQGRKQVTG
ncbi:Tat (twin-arginine translocation) pathway signal sequence [Thermomonospora echinospora]|uniref:Tat (Twin-arginine translocation) pathway signal sequence n=1 Tax=Thermomonospora echinospora TaxID=1992 RepID=A0A1H6E077_9ACTN|nr:twin-arginine translocation signal domain-containing protein [Thermomonospora echinospora]SEG90769.1 Tat (twin-arginine translocation) pathway signal sequence [Thermomonospora echinospora]